MIGGCGEDGVEVMYCLPSTAYTAIQAVALWGKGDLRFLESSGLQFTVYSLRASLESPWNDPEVSFVILDSAMGVQVSVETVEPRLIYQVGNLRLPLFFLRNPTFTNPFTLIPIYQLRPLDAVRSPQPDCL
jgi:hypothetical protein